MLQREPTPIASRRAARFYAALVRTAGAILRAEDRATLFDAVCRIAVEQGGVRMAWVGRVDADSRRVVPVACHGQGCGYLQESLISADAAHQEGLGPTGIALREGRSIVLNDLGAEPAFDPWREAANRHGFHASAAIPLRVGNATVGAVGFYAAEAGFFDSELVALLEVMAGEISFALDRMGLEESRRNNESDLARHESRLRAIFETEPECVKLLDRAGRLLEMNPAGLAMIGADSLEQVRGRNMSALLVPEDRDAFGAMLDAVFLGESRQLVFDIVGLKGARRTLETHSVPLRDGAADGSVQALLGLTRDITEQRLAEQQLRRSEENLKVTLHSIGEAVVATDAAGCVRLMNPVAERLTGWSAADADGKPLAEVLHLTDEVGEHAIADPVAQVMASGGAIGTARGTLLTALDGTVRPIGWNAAPIRPGAEGGIQGVAVVLRDQTREAASRRDLEREERKYRSLLGQVQAIIYIADLHNPGALSFVSPQVGKILGFDPSEVLADPQWRQRNIHPDDWPQVCQRHALTVATLAPFRAEYRMFARDGRVAWIADTATVLPDDEGTPRFLHGLMFDITLYREQADELRRNEERLRVAIASTSMSVFNQDRDLRYTWIFNSRLGLRHEDVVGRTDSDIMAAVAAERLTRVKRQVIESGTGTKTETTLTLDGVDHFFELTLEPLRDVAGQVTGLTGAAVDITERKAAEAQIEYLAHHDALTGLPNRVLLRDRMAQSLATARRAGSRVALLFLDLDRFKHVNDSLGHLIGDHLLRAAAERIVACVRAIDTVSRQGGDEFLILLTDVQDARAVGRVAEKILGTMVAPFEIEGHVITTSFSIGISIFPDDAVDYDALLRQADTALYQAKEAGRGAYRFFTDQMNIAAMERMRLETNLRQALERGELYLEYQAQVDLQSGRIVGAEALLRWAHPVLGNVPPARFIPVAEDTGLIVPIGTWVLNEACRQVQAWRQAGLPFQRVAVNLSAIQFRRTDLVATVRAALHDSGLDPAALEGEITESLLVDSSSQVQETMRQLKGLGIRLSVDDFGVGYSGLRYLKLFDIDKIKIDRTFVLDIPGDAEDVTLVRAIIQLAHSLKLEVVAEGVENDAQLALLRSFGCHEVQGYLFGRPMAASEFAERLAAQ